MPRPGGSLDRKIASWGPLNGHFECEYSFSFNGATMFGGRFAPGVDRLEKALGGFSFETRLIPAEASSSKESSPGYWLEARVTKGGSSAQGLEWIGMGEEERGRVDVELRIQGNDSGWIQCRNAFTPKRPRFE